MKNISEVLACYLRLALDKEYITLYTVSRGRLQADPKYERSFYHGKIEIYC